VGLAERIEVIRNKLGVSERELGRRAGLADAHVGLLVRRLRSDPGAVNLKTLIGLAQAGGVSLAWLVSGEELPGQPHPSKAAAAERARASGVWEEAIRSVMCEPGEERSEEWWFLRMKMREIEMLEEARRLESTRSTASTDAPPASVEKTRTG
jgi:transcriptional regulator with XRE-family HTH domain